MRFECVQKQESDARTIFEWRKDPQTLRMSFHTTPPTWEDFYDTFLREYFAFPDLPPLFACVEGARIAFLRFTPVSHPQGLNRRCCDISINVAPTMRGQGLGTEILVQIQRWVQTQGYDDLLAEIRIENMASEKAFQGAGFLFLDAIPQEIFDTGETIAVKRYLATLTAEKPAKKVFIIAEVGSNWRLGSPSRDRAMAKALIESAAEAGADAVKFQTYRPETIYVPNAGKSRYLSKAGIEEEMSKMFHDLAMPYEMIPELAEMCRLFHVQFLSTPFSPADFTAIDPFVTMHKIASYEIGHVQLLTLAAKSGKPLLLSTGASTEEEIAWAVNTYRQQGGEQLTLLQCTAAYPAGPSSLHLRTIPWLKKRFQVPVGLSDHSQDPITAPIAAVAWGASVIEKHFTLNRSLPGPDHAFAILPEELKELVRAVRQAEEMCGEEVKAVDPTENELRAFAKRGVQALADIKKGDLFVDGVNIAILRPGVQSLGVHPKYLQEIVGKTAQRAIPLGSGIMRGDWA